MPHFVIDCSENITNSIDTKNLLMSVHSIANKSGLFDEKDIKIRLNPFDKDYLVGGKEGDFVHIFANIMEGRTIGQKSDLSRQMVKKLKELLPNVPFIAMNIRDFEKATYCNKNMI